MAESEIVHFTVTGEFITEKARDFWNVEDAPEKALALLRTLDGITEQQILDICEGRSKLTGDSNVGVGLAPDTAGGKKLEDILRDLKAERDEARDERADLVQMAVGDTVSMGSPTGLRKVARRKTTRTPISGRSSLAEDYEFDDVLNDPETPVVKGRGTKPLRIWQQCESSGYLSSRAREEAADDQDFIEEFGDDEEEVVPPPPPAEFTIRANGQDGASGWLSPEGKFYPCGYAQHAQTAWKLGLTDNPQAHGLEVDGWARLGVTDGRQYFFGEHTLFNDTVRSRIKAYCTEKEIEPPYWLEDDSLEEK